MDVLVEEALDRRISAEIRARRARTIARLGLEGAIEVLLRIIADPTEPEEVRQAARYGLGLARDPGFSRTFRLAT